MPYSKTPDLETYTGTGAQTEIPVEAGVHCSIGVNVGSGDDVDLQVKIQSSGEWYTLDSNIGADLVRTNVGPIMAVRLNITTNSSGAVKLEVAQARM